MARATGNHLFDVFWLAYPRRVSKGQAERTWKKLNPTQNLFHAILAGVELAKRYDPKWLDAEENPRKIKYVPHPSTWLNARGWEDEYPTPPAPTGQDAIDNLFNESRVSL